MQPDTLLNVFLAIAVDNLANAQELTKVTLSFTALVIGFYSVFHLLIRFYMIE